MTQVTRMIGGKAVLVTVVPEGMHGSSAGAKLHARTAIKTKSIHTTKPVCQHCGAEKRTVFGKGFVCAIECN